jgi:hypothetical protein
MANINFLPHVKLSKFLAIPRALPLPLRDAIRYYLVGNLLNPVKVPAHLREKALEFLEMFELEDNETRPDVTLKDLFEMKLRGVNYKVNL